MFILSRDQKKAFDDVMEWYQKIERLCLILPFGGYAGTGKTTFIAHLRKRLTKLNKKLKVGFASYTGKASRVLRNKLRETDTIMGQDTVGTIHSLIYSPIVDEKERIIGWKTKDKIDRDLIIIDEASMVDSLIWQHLIAYKIPIIVVGDHGQLPPSKETSISCKSLISNWKRYTGKQNITPSSKFHYLLEKKVIYRPEYMETK